MKTNFQMVREFHEKFDHPISSTPKIPDENLITLRVDLIEEELEELIEAHALEDKKKRIVDIADALTDLLYVVYGAGLVYGIDLDACFKEVHESNMSKLGEDGKPVKRADGKVLKGPNYRKPDLSKVLLGEVA